MEKTLSTCIKRFRKNKNNNNTNKVLDGEEHIIPQKRVCIE